MDRTRLTSHIEHIREIYNSHIQNVNNMSREKFNNKHVTYKKFTGNLDENENPVYKDIEGKVKDVYVTSDHDLMLEIVDIDDNKDIIFSFHVLEIKE
jgi:hypothetical protein